MVGSLILLSALTLAGTPPVQSVCVQVAPTSNGKFVRSANRTQAVVLIHGFHYHLLDKNVPKATFRPWQNADSTLVKTLGKTTDVYSFAYGQNVSIDTIVKESALVAHIADLRRLGYTDVVLVGHSAGGIIARQFVEDHPKAGVTKVIQVCAPNEGSPLANFTVPKSHRIFVECLRTDHRKKCLEMRADKSIPKEVQFICVVARDIAKPDSDGVVPCASQWTDDLRKQGVGAVLVSGTHRDVVREEPLAATLARLVDRKHERHTPDEIDRMRKYIFGK